MTKTPDSKINENLVRKLGLLLTELELSEIEYESDGLRIKVSKNLRVSNTREITDNDLNIVTEKKQQEPHSQVKKSDQKDAPGTITSPMVGVAYLSSDPESEPFVKIGDKIPANHTLLLIEAMKVFNQIKSPKAGVVTKILIENGTPVEFGEPLIIIE